VELTDRTFEICLLNWVELRGFEPLTPRCELVAVRSSIAFELVIRRVTEDQVA